MSAQLWSLFVLGAIVSPETIQSLENRRLIADLLWCYKIVFNIVDISIDELFCSNTCTYTRGHAHKLYKSRPLNDQHWEKLFFSERVISVWNALPADLVDFTSLSRFRSSI